MILWLSFWLRFEPVRTGKENMTWEVKYSQIWAQKKKTQADIRCQLSTTFNFTEKVLTSTRMQPLDREQYPFSPSTFNDFEMGSEAENSILFDEMQNKENSDLQQVQPLRDKSFPFSKLLLWMIKQFFRKISPLVKFVGVSWVKKSFHIITTFIKNYANVFEINTFTASLSKLLLVAAIFWIYHIHTEKIVGYQSKTKK